MKKYSMTPEIDKALAELQMTHGDVILEVNGRVNAQIKAEFKAASEKLIRKHGQFVDDGTPPTVID